MPTILLTLALMSMAALSAPDERAAFTAAGFTFNGKEWRQCTKAGGQNSTPGLVWIVDDLNRDGQFEALLIERNAACYGAANQGYWLVGKQAGGNWRLIAKGTGAPEVLDTRGVGNWPDLEIRGPGKCFPVLRWNGKAYAPNRRAAAGQPCR